MTKIIAFFLFYLVCNLSFGQGGYYNKKNYIKADVQALFPNIIYNYYNFDLPTSIYNEKLMQKKDRFNYGFHFSAYRIIKKKIALGIELGTDFSDIYLPTRTSFLIEPNYDQINLENIQISKIEVQTYSFIPKIEFVTGNGFLPMGFTHEIGVGAIFSHIVKKDYPFNYNAITSNDKSGILTEEYIKSHLFNYNVYAVQNYTLLYALNLKIPLLKYLFFNYGFRYTLNIKPFLSDNYEPRMISDFIYSNGVIDQSIQKQKIRSLFNFSFGLTYVF
jgi:hypothetical protein